MKQLAAYIHEMVGASNTVPPVQRQVIDEDPGPSTFSQSLDTSLGFRVLETDSHKPLIQPAFSTKRKREDEKRRVL